MRLSAMKRDMLRNEGRTDLHKKLCPCPKCLSKLEETEIASGHLRLVTHNTAVAHHKRWVELFSQKDPNEIQSVPLFQPLFGLEPTAGNISHVLHIFANRQGFPRGGRKRRFRANSEEDETKSDMFRPHKTSRTAVEAATAAISAAAAAAGHQIVPDSSLSYDLSRLVEHSQGEPWLYSELVKLFHSHGILLLDDPMQHILATQAQAEAQAQAQARAQVQAQVQAQVNQAHVHNGGQATSQSGVGQSPATHSGQQYPYAYSGAPGVPPPPHQLSVFGQPSPHQYVGTAHSSGPQGQAPPPPPPSLPHPENVHLHAGGNAAHHDPNQVHASSPDGVVSAAAAAAAAAAAVAAAAAQDAEHHPTEAPLESPVPVPPNA